MPIQITCPKCGKKLRLPDNFQKPKGICPKCNHVFKLSIPKRLSVSLYDVILMHSNEISQYGKDLSKLYSMIKSQMIHKKEFEEQKQILRKILFSALIEKSINIGSFNLDERTFIEIWTLILELLPTKAENTPSNFISNIYPRYEFACFISLTYLLSEIKDRELANSILIEAIDKLKSNKSLKKNIEEIMNSKKNNNFIEKSKIYLTFIRNLNKTYENNSNLNISQMSEDFGFGISWISFHIDK